MRQASAFVPGSPYYCLKEVEQVDLGCQQPAKAVAWVVSLPTVVQHEATISATVSCFPSGHGTSKVTANLAMNWFSI